MGWDRNSLLLAALLAACGGADHGGAPPIDDAGGRADADAEVPRDVAGPPAEASPAEASPADAEAPGDASFPPDAKRDADDARATPDADADSGASPIDGGPADADATPPIEDAGAEAGPGDAAGTPGADAGHRTIVVLGSSTARGKGAVPASTNSWVSLYRAYVTARYPDLAVVNLAVSGFTTYQAQPDDFVPPPRRPLPDPAHNVTAALARDPSAIIVNFPSNDQEHGYTLVEEMGNLDRMAAAASARNVAFWVATSQPRNFTEQARRDALMAVRDAIQARFRGRSIDFWTGLAEPDGTINPLYDSDGVHPNNAGHALLADRVIAARIPQRFPM